MNDISPLGFILGGLAGLVNGAGINGFLCISTALVFGSVIVLLHYTQENKNEK